MRRLLAPASYVQGSGVLADGDTYGTLAGEIALVLGGDTALSVAEDALREGLGAAGIEVAAVEAGIDAVTFDEIDRVAGIARSAGAGVVVGVGGGVALDVAKGAAARTGAELATVPTIASTDAPCSSVAVVYDAAGAFDGYVHRDRNPEVVAADTRIIAEAPPRFLRYGMGDAFATRFEAEAVARGRAATHAGGRPLDTPLAIARRCYETIDTHGTDALAAAERDAVTPALERVVEANALLSGVGFESGGLAGAHAVNKGMGRAGAENPHGVAVAFGTIVQLVLEDHDDLGAALDLYHGLGLAASPSDLGIADRVGEVATEACREDTTMDNEPLEVTPEAVADAIRTADELISRRGT